MTMKLPLWLRLSVGKGSPERPGAGDATSPIPAPSASPGRSYALGGGRRLRLVPTRRVRAISDAERIEKYRARIDGAGSVEGIGQVVADAKRDSTLPPGIFMVIRAYAVARTSGFRPKFVPEWQRRLYRKKRP